MASKRRMYGRPASLLLTFLWALALVAWSPTVAMAQGLDSRLAQILEAAQDDYDMLLFDEAEEALQFGLEQAENEGLRTPTVAKLYMMLGIVRHAQDESLTEDAFIQAIETYPGVELDPLYRTPALQEIFERAQDRAEPPEVDTVSEPDPDVELESMSHEPVRRTRAGEPLLVEARIPEDLPVFRVYFYYRRFGETDFIETEMLPSDAVTFAVTVEGEEVYTTQLEYYIYAVNRGGDPIAEAGRRSAPHRVSVLGDTGERPVAQPHVPGDGDRIDDPDRPERDPGATGFYAFLAGGTDIGFLPSGTPPTANEHRTVSPGLAPAFAHTMLELGWRISELNNIGLYFRWQFSPPQDFSALPEDRFDQNAPFFQSQQECFGMGLPGDCLLGLKYQRVISAGRPEFYSSVGMGVGRVRNWLRLKEATSDTNPNPICTGRDILNDPNGAQFCYIRDTVRTGWFHFGLGGGLFLPVHDMLDLVADTYLMVLVPDTSVNMDFNLGLRLRL